MLQEARKGPQKSGLVVHLETMGSFGAHNLRSSIVLAQRQGNAERRPTRVTIRRGQRPVMCGDDRLADRQAHAHPAGLAAPERLENVL